MYQQGSVLTANTDLSVGMYTGDKVDKAGADKREYWTQQLEVEVCASVITG